MRKKIEKILKEGYFGYEKDYDRKSVDKILKLFSSQRKELIEEIEKHIKGLIEVDKILKTKGEEYEVVLYYLDKLKKKEGG